jgi:hypothetical protein
MGFVTFVIIAVLAIALFYSGGIRDRIKVTQMANCANKIISTAESVFYSGYPSKATITCYLPEGIQNIFIDTSDYKSDLVFMLQSSTGKTTTSFASNVELKEKVPGVLADLAAPGSKKIVLEAMEDLTGNWVYINKG